MKKVIAVVLFIVASYLLPDQLGFFGKVVPLIMAGISGMLIAFSKK